MNESIDLTELQILHNVSLFNKIKKSYQYPDSEGMVSKGSGANNKALVSFSILPFSANRAVTVAKHAMANSLEPRLDSISTLLFCDPSTATSIMPLLAT